jgi:hypothetical protein
MWAKPRLTDEQLAKEERLGIAQSTQGQTQYFCVIVMFIISKILAVVAVLATTTEDHK